MKTIIAVLFLMLTAASVASAQEILALSYRESQEQLQISVSPEKWVSDVEFYKNFTEKKTIEHEPWIREPRNIKEVASELILFGSGIGVGFLKHEIGHQIVASAVNAEFKWNQHLSEIGTNGWTAISSRDNLQKIIVGGFFSQIVGSEMTFQSREKGLFNCGNLVFNVLNSVGYVYNYERAKGVQGDIGQFKKFGGDVKILETVLLSHAFYSAYRLYNGGGEPLFNVSADTETGRLIISKNFKF